MKKEYKITGMNCMHCVKSVKNALNSLGNVNVTVTLEPPVAIITFHNEEIPIEKLQEQLANVGDYKILQA